MNGITVLPKSPLGASLSLPLCDITVRRQRVGTGHQTCQHLDLGFPASRAVREKCLFCTPHPPYGVLFRWPARTR